MAHSLACPIAFEASPFPSEIRVLGELFPDYYCDYLEQCTRQVLVDFFGPDFGQLCFDPYSELPLIEVIFPSHAPGLLRIALLCEGDPLTNGAGRHMADLFNQWLVPGESLNVPCSLAVHFIFTANPEKKFFLCHLLLSLETETALFKAKKEIEPLTKVLKKTISCVAHLRKLLDKNLPDFPLFDQNFFEHASHLLKNGKRGEALVARILGLKHLFTRRLKKKFSENPHQRHICLKIFPLMHGGAQPDTLGILIGLSLVREGEMFESKHLLKALRQFIPDICLASEPFVQEKGDQKIRLFYLEVKKTRGIAFSSAELLSLRKELAKECKASVETLLHPLFMPRNEEDLLRFSLQLCSQLDDLPSSLQMAIFFGNQTAEILCFSVILARIVDKLHPTSLSDCLKQTPTLFDYADVEMRYPPCTEKHYRKEMISFTAKLPKDPYLRSDYTIDVLKARHELANQIQEVFGNVRDYNGGLLESQARAEQTFLATFEASSQRDLDLAKQFFHAITPSLMQIILDPSLLKSVFLDLRKAIHEGAFASSSALCDRYEYLILKSQNPDVKREAQRRAEELCIPASKLTFALVGHGEEYYLIVLHQNEEQNPAFAELRECLNEALNFFALAR